MKTDTTKKKNHFALIEYMPTATSTNTQLMQQDLKIAR